MNIKTAIAILIGIIGLMAGCYNIGRDSCIECDTTIECGSCGAHVHDWWYVDNVHTGESIEVCEFCYQAAIS